MNHKNQTDDSVASECAAHIRQMPPHVRARRTAQLMERLLAENKVLKSAVADALEWNWLDDDAPGDLRESLMRLCR